MGERSGERNRTLKSVVYKRRIEQVRTEMRHLGIDLALFSPSSNLTYLSGYDIAGDERLFVLAIPAQAPPFVIANQLTKAQAQIIPVDEFVFWEDGDSPERVLLDAIKQRNIQKRKVAIEGRTPTSFFLKISETLNDATFVNAEMLTYQARQYKDADEIETIAIASVAADEAFVATIERGVWWLGRTELDFSEYLSSELRTRGVLSYGAIVASGDNAAVPHHGASARRIENNRCLLVDFGGAFEHYHTDITRTIHFGTPSKEFEKVYNIVLEAHFLAEEAVRIGGTMGEIDAAARGHIEKSGYGEQFIHRTGHGIGMDVHEGASVMEGEDTVIEPGMVFSIEPGIYLPGKFGVRIENLVAIEHSGIRVLHTFPRELIVIK
jgi:Xaa-Pro aminopeptidase